MNEIPAVLRAEVLARAANRCEYCHLSQAGQEAAFHVDHVVPRAAGGPTQAGNLALACVSCSLRKGARQAAIDPETQAMAPIYDPRRQRWDEHFRWNGPQVVPMTATGRATVAALAMNRPLVLAIRLEEAARSPSDGLNTAGNMVSQTPLLLNRPNDLFTASLL